MSAVVGLCDVPAVSSDTAPFMSRRQDGSKEYRCKEYRYSEECQPWPHGAGRRRWRPPSAQERQCCWQARQSRHPRLA